MKLKLQIPPGINTGDTAYAYPGIWDDGSNVRFWRNFPQTIGGWESVTTSTLSGVCRTVLPWVDNASLLNIACGQHDRLSVVQGGTIYDITPASGFTAGQIDGTGGAGYGTGAYGVGTYGSPSTSDYFPLTWSFGNYGQSLIANPRNQGIFWWQNVTGTPAATLTNSPAQCTYVLVTPTRQIMALGCNEEVSTTFNPLCIRFSDPEDPTDWTTTSSNLAGEVILEGGGRIVGAQLAGNNVFVWTNNALHLGRFTGDSTQPWVFDKVADDCGLIGPNAAAITSQTAYWLSSNGRFFTCSTGGVPQIIPLATGDEMVDNLAPSQNDKIVCSSVSKFNEIWWFYADNRDGYEVSRYIAIDAQTGSSFKGVLARTAFCDSGPGSDKYPIGITYGGNIYYHEKGTSADGGVLTSYLESSMFYLSDSESVQMIRGLWPDFKNQQGLVSITSRAFMYPQSVETVLGPYSSPVSQEKIDYRNSGRLFKIRFDSSAAPSFWRLGEPTLDVVSSGAR